MAKTGAMGERPSFSRGRKGEWLLAQAAAVPTRGL